MSDVEKKLWLLLASQFAEHVHNQWGDRTPQDALNRIAKKVLAPHGMELPVRLGPETCTIQHVVRSRAQLEDTVKFHSRRHPGDLPPTLLMFRGREFIVDGHNRINQYLADGRQEPLEVLLITPRG